MWLKRNIYDDLKDLNARQRNDVDRLQAVNAELRSRVAAQDTTIDWFRVRITQLEMERAQLLYNYTGVKIATPSIERAPESDVARALQATQHFQDMGDNEAGRLGIGWNEDGTLKAE